MTISLRRFATVVALLLLSHGCSRPDIPRIAMCAEAELEDGTISFTGSTTFVVAAASIVSGEARRLPADNGGGQCGDAGQRFEFELADTSDKRFWFAFSLFGDGEFERPDVPDLAGGDFDAQATINFGFPDVGSIQVNDGAGLVFAAELNATNEPHELGGMTLLLGDKSPLA